MSDINQIPIIKIIEKLAQIGFEIDENGCHNWKGYIQPNGYGRFRVAGVSLAAHRAAYVVSRGFIPDGADICHACDNRRCLNPEHLFVGSRQENMLDCKLKGRLSIQQDPSRILRGDRHKNRKLSSDQVAEIRASTDNAYQVAERYRISPSHVWRLRSNQQWGGTPSTARAHTKRRKNTKLSPDAIGFIRKSDLSLKQLADIYGVSQSCIQHAKSGYTWRTIDPATLGKEG